MTLIKTSILSAIATILKIISGFIVTKVIAVYVGPSGLAVIGQLQNFINIVLIFAGGFLKTATTKYTAEYLEDEVQKHSFWSTVVSMVFILNIFTFILLFFFSDEISEYLLKSTEYAFVLKILAISIPFFVLNTILLSILNGHRQIKKYIILSVCLSFVSLILVTFLSLNYGLSGALIAYAINQSVVFIITLVFVQNETWFKIKHFLHGSNYPHIKKLLGFGLITLVAILASNLSLIYIRNFITEAISIESAGHWQGIWSLSQVSFMLITTSMTTYFLPTISALKSKGQISKEIKNAFVFIIPIAIIMSLIMYFSRDLIISILYTEQFTPMRELFLWQVVGNVVKVCGWMFGYVLVAKAMVKYTVSTEIIFAIVFVGLSVYFINNHGLIGVTYAYAINSLLHFITMLYIYRFKLAEGV